MLRKIGTNPFNFGPKFYGWMANFDHVPLVRSYCGRADYRNLYLMLQVYDPTNYTRSFVEKLLMWEQERGANAGLRFEQERETTFAVVGARNDNQNGFLMDNFLDAVGVRVHHVLDGEGVFRRADGSHSLEYVAGDLLVFDAEDFGQRWIHDAKPGHQLITCWATTTSSKRNWQLFAEHERKYNIREARQ